eukprot:symbB.v1.2.001249.t1/scaffold63.1/size477159/20
MLLKFIEQLHGLASTDFSMLAPVIDQGVTGFPAGFAAYVAWVDVLPKFQEMSDPEADASENEDVPNEPAVVIDRIDETTLNAALFFTVKPSELRILSVLGAGGHANVYKADWCRSFGMGTSSIIVAVKQLHTDLGEVYRNRERLTMLTDHPNLVKCMDSTLEPPYLIITEFLAGGSLFDLLYNSSQELSLWQSLKILLDVASGMRYLHEQKPCILHRDLKSSNILLAKPLRSATQEPFAKVADFGLSRTSSHSTGVTKEAMTAGVGTWRWMAPEVFENDEGPDDVQYNSKADVYSFGILMYEMLERRMPYSERFGNDISDPRISLYVSRGLRPALESSSASASSEEGPTALIRKELIALMQRAWDSDPSVRPDFQLLEEELRRLWSSATLP